MKSIKSPQQMSQIMRLIREQNGLSQQQLAHRAKTRQATISKLENDASGVKVGTLLKILAIMQNYLIIAPEGIAQDKTQWKEEW